MEKVKDLIHHLFVPSEKNNFRAQGLHFDFLTYYLVFAFSLMIFFKSVGPGLTNVLGFATDITVQKLQTLTNQQREKNGLGDLSYNDKLAQAAYNKAQDMFAKNYWAHYSPTGGTPWDFILGANYQYEFAGENLAKNFLFSQGVVDAWMNSSTHRENILKKNYTEVGFAVVNGVLNGEETTLVVQMFGKPSNFMAMAKKEPVVNQPVNNYPAPSVLSKIKNKSMVNLGGISFNISYIFIFFLMTVLVTDFYVAAKMNVVRINGKNLAHFIFLGFIFLGLLLFFSKGTII